jgi:hypothetical protein
MLTLYIWLLLALPRDHMICSMWTADLSAQAMKAAGCPAELSPDWTVMAININTGVVECEISASTLPAVPCAVFPVDNYLIQVHDPDWVGCQTVVTLDHPGQPSDADVLAACQPGTLDEGYSLTLDRIYQIDPPPAPAPVCHMPELTAADLVPLTTTKDYHLLDANLYWTYGIVDLDLAWQNRFDEAILRAGLSEKVPPSVIKEMFAQESQFWPLLPQQIDLDLGEVGLGQLTDAGADLVLRYDADIYSAACGQALAPDTCSMGYALMSPAQRLMVRNVFRRSLMVYGTLEDAANQTNSQMDVWARVLRAYYCSSGEIVSGWGTRPAAERWDMTLAAYHAGLNCLTGGTVCLEGLKYLSEVHK